MNFKSFALIFLFVFSFANAEKIVIKRKDIPEKNICYKTWEIEDTFFKQEMVSLEYLKNIDKEMYQIFHAKPEIIFLDEHPKWEAIALIKINYIELSD